MGTRFELALVVDDTQASVAAIGAVGELALREIEDWHQRLTRFEADSWLSHVNRSAAYGPVRLDDETVPLFSDAMQVWRDSGGAFDIARGGGAALAFDHDARTLQFLNDDVSLDLGAIGKGHALDCAAACLRSHGVTRAFLQGGASSGIAMGRAPDADGWRIGVSSVTNAAEPDDVVELADTSFSLSDEAGQPDAPFGRHIVDPRLAGGSPPVQTSRRVLVTGPSARVADAWSTALVVLGVVPPAFPESYTARFLRE